MNYFPYNFICDLHDVICFSLRLQIKIVLEIYKSQKLYYHQESYNSSESISFLDKKKYLTTFQKLSLNSYLHLFLPRMPILRWAKSQTYILKSYTPNSLNEMDQFCDTSGLLPRALHARTTCVYLLASFFNQYVKCVLKQPLAVSHASQLSKLI